MSRQLATCPVCKTDQHIYRKRIANHDDGLLRCSGSKAPLIGGEAIDPAEAIAKGILRVLEGESFARFYEDKFVPNYIQDSTLSKKEVLKEIQKVFGLVEE